MSWLSAPWHRLTYVVDYGTILKMSQLPEGSRIRRFTTILPADDLLLPLPFQVFPSACRWFDQQCPLVAYLFVLAFNLACISRTARLSC
jgi:hypothetical protein